MSKAVAIRSGRDRLRYTVSFEVLLMMMLVPAGAIFFEKGLAEIGVLGIVLSLKAMALGLLYNWVIDKLEAKSGRIASERGFLGRALHAVGFELSLLITSLPIYVWWLNLTYLEALATDLTITTFVVAYTFLFTLAYDRVFPIGATSPPAMNRAIEY